jgi:hypothetical protein
MSDYTVVADVGETLKRLLWDHVRMDNRMYPDILTSEDDITLFSPQEMESGNSKKLSLFLYNIAENTYMKNKEVQNADAVKLKYNPLFLDLFYLVTPNTGDRKKDHILLGKVMQVFYDNAIIRGSILQGVLSGTAEELHVTLYSLPFDELIRLWQSFSEESFKLSVSYRITPVHIDSTRTTKSKRFVTMSAEKGK